MRGVQAKAMAIPIDSEGWLAPGRYGNVTVIRHDLITKTTPYDAQIGGKPLGIVWHWAAGGYGAGHSNDVTNYTISESYNADRKASWHFFITKNGEIHQFAPVSIGTWTTGAGGKLYDPSLPSKERTMGNVNRATVGVETENAGVLLKGPDGHWYAWPYGDGAEGLSEVQARDKAAQGGIIFKSVYRVAPERAQAWSDGNVYDAWPAAQQQAAQEMARSVAAWAGWKDPRHIHYGHRTFYVKRDPGLLWMDGVLPSIERNIFGSAASSGSAGGSAGSGKAGVALLGAALGFSAVYLFMRRK